MDPRGAKYGSAPELSIVIPTLDALSDRVERCIAAIRLYTKAAHETIVIENRSPPQGFTDPVNAGIRAASGPYVVVLNDDVEVLEGWWPPLRKALDDGALVAFPDSFRGFPQSEILFAPCLALSREAIDEHSHAPGAFFDPAFKIWFQDSDLLLRLCERKRPPVRVSESRIAHEWSSTIRRKDPGLTGWKELEDWIEEQTARDRETFVEKWSGGRRGPRARAIVEPYLESEGG